MAAAIALLSFGYKFGCSLRTRSGWRTPAWCETRSGWPSCAHIPVSTPQSRDYVLEDPVARELIERTRALVLWSAQRYAERGRRRLSVAVGCTGGRHRSVAIVEALAPLLREDGLIVAAGHRDVDTPDPRFE